MNKYRKPKYEETDLGINPLLTNLEIEVVKYNSGTEFKKVGNNYEPKILEYERTPYVKLFRTMQARITINGLSDKAMRLFLWLMQTVDCGKDNLWINRDRYMLEQNIKSPTTVTNALKELHKFNFISPTPVQNVYWINPALFFCGNRIEKYKDKIVIINEQTNS